MRVKINQLENDLLHQIKRLDIICKSKGLPRPKRDILNKDGAGAGSASRTGGTYVSPYGANRNNRVSPGATANRSTGGYSGSRGRPGAVPTMPGASTSANRVARVGGSIGSNGSRQNKYVNNNYTPPNRNPRVPNFHSPAGSIGNNSNKGSGYG